ncbi:MAG: hypothetical protein VW239_01110 [Candidatus Nanopelagicales bacterium]
MTVDGHTRALFPGQVYDLPRDVVEGVAWLEPVEAKAIHNAPMDKAVRGPERTKRRGTK